MEPWDIIIHTALLGTDKKALKQEELPAHLADVYDIISKETDKEETFLHLAAVASNYRKCGSVPLHEKVAYAFAEDETNLYCNAMAHQVLNALLSVESYSLLSLWLQECNARNLIVQPEVIPVLFDLAGKQKNLQQQIVSVTGKRGAWLLPLNEAWKFDAQNTDETVWQTGTTEERKLYLQALRKKEPSGGRELLQQTWPHENANTKTDLVKQLSVGISDEDIAWLESLLNDKSQKVKDEVMKLLKLLPQSSVIQKYWGIIQQSIYIKKERGLLGIGNETILEIGLPTNIDETVFKTGIEKISSNKNIDDDDFILYQLISAVPPSFFEEHFALSKEALLALFSQSKKGKQLVPAFGAAAVHFKEKDWFKTILASSENEFYPEAFLLLNHEEKEAYALSFLQKNEQEPTIIEQLKKHHQKEWSIALAKAVLRYTANNSYSYNHSFYNGIILSVPVSIIMELEKCTPTDEYTRNQWSKTSDYIIQLLTLRTQILQAFQS